MPAGVRYSGELPSGIAAVNNIALRGRRLGFDVLQAVQAAAPVHIVGMGAEAIGGPGEIAPLELAEYESHYRFFLNPMRWTSLSMAVCEAMHVGMPILGLATTEMSTVIRNGVEGYIETDIDKLCAHARRLIADPQEAAELGQRARETAQRRFGIARFVADWEAALALATGASPPPTARSELEVTVS
jgi:glycosyltransferase involved in cell wall biosynthesis